MPDSNALFELPYHWEVGGETGLAVFSTEKKQNCLPLACCNKDFGPWAPVEWEVDQHLQLCFHCACAELFSLEAVSNLKKQLYR